MADWKQITARIRRARGSKDPAGQLALLYEKTKDAMVAFELGRHFEIVRDPAQALQWYQSAYSRFRRGDWKTKSSEAITRLGGELPLGPWPKTASAEEPPRVPLPTVPEPASPFERNAQTFASLVTEEIQQDSPSRPSPPEPESARQKPRRRGRRGGR